MSQHDSENEDEEVRDRVRRVIDEDRELFGELGN
jgi:hypothetical protein